LTWSEDLVEAAKKEADKCVWKHTKHDEFGEVSANLRSLWNDLPGFVLVNILSCFIFKIKNIAAGQNSASEVVIAWVEGPNEREVWNPSSAVATHFTRKHNRVIQNSSCHFLTNIDMTMTISEVVWKDTKQIGCAFRSCETIAGSNLPQSPVMFWACEYHP
jgi:hypothetical protein